MASEYLKKLAREQNDTPAEPKRERTSQEKWQNWWDYNKVYVYIALAVILIVGWLVMDTVRNREPEADYQLAVVGSHYLPEEEVLQLQDALVVYGQDLNGDGQVLVKVKEYPIFADETNFQTVMAAQVQLSADFELCASVVLLVEDPERIQSQLEILDEQVGWYAWEDCPALADLVEEDTYLSSLYVARRGLNEEELAQSSGAIAFWEVLIQGAK